MLNYKDYQIEASQPVCGHCDSLHELVSAIRCSQLFLLQVAHQHDGPLFIFLSLSLPSSSQKHTRASCQMKSTLQNNILRLVTNMCNRCMDWFSRSSVFRACRGLSQTHELLCQSHGWPGFTDSWSRSTETPTAASQVIGFHLRPTIDIVFQYHY